MTIHLNFLKKIGDFGMVVVVLFVLTLALSFNVNSILAYYYIAFTEIFILGIASLFIGFFGLSHLGHFLSGKLDKV